MGMVNEALEQPRDSVRRRDEPVGRERLDVVVIALKGLFLQ
jgi:hypothetical protein